ncbi:amidase [Caenimonas aquaedulcis]|uniref:Amidase n=1 Tax=Caenimonas aquaedulcis TaxID=2793270 RepID=A0A931H7V4_9BURK|nr:amidase [Caenimonas aquaedulcis]MBG9390314.1 amidase [Caenimonas aquaedulcis]
MTDLWRLGALALSDGYRRRDFDPVDALHACLARVAACQGAVNAMLHVDAAGALASARESAARWSRGQPLSPLDGVPVSLKDNLHAAGMPTTWGSRLLEGFIAPQDELPVARLRATGAVIFGKTMLPEFALQGVTENLLAGATRNPWNLARTPGGSSGGAAAAVACGMGPLALATDGGGSTRRPASHTGVVGFKPGADWLARGGGLPEIFLHFEQPGLMARRVADVQAFAHAMVPPGATDETHGPVRLLFVRTFADHPVDAGIAAAVERAASQFASMGHAVTEVAGVGWSEAVNDAWPSLSNAGLAWMLADASRFPELGQRGTQPVDLERCGAAARANAAHGAGLSATALFDALAAVRTLQARLVDVFSAHDFILTPATAAPPWPLGETHPALIAGRPAGPRGHAIFTAFVNAAGLPAIALPGGFAGGLPVGFQLVGPRGADASLLAFAHRWEQAFPPEAVWPPEPPPTMAAP